MDDSEHTSGLADALTRRRVSRKKLLAAAAGAAGVASVGGIGLLAGTRNAKASGGSDNTSGDTPQQVFTAALIAEDLATTFYYNALVGPVIQDPNLAGKGGTATNPSPNKNKSNPGNVAYLRAALNEEIQHANLLRSLIGGSSASGDPVRTFYFNGAAFQDLADFLGLLNALESAFIGAYLAATEEFAQMAADTKAGVTTFNDAGGHPYASGTLEYFAKVASAIQGVEAEHRVLGRVIGGMDPANQLNYEQTDGINSVYNGGSSAVAAVTPFLSSAGGSAYSFADALAGASALILPTSGGLPPS